MCYLFKLLTSITTIDKDLSAATHYTAYLEKDYNGLFSVGHPTRMVVGLGFGSFYTTGRPSEFHIYIALKFDSFRVLFQIWRKINELFIVLR